MNRINNTAATNTDNKGKLFVTVFAFATACVTNTYAAKPGTRSSARMQTSAPWLKSGFDQVYTATLRSVASTHIIPVTQKWSQDSLYRDRSHTESGLYPDGKNRAVLRSLRPL